MKTASTEREAIVAWLRLPRKATYATFRLRIALAFFGLFRPQYLVEAMAEALGDSIERGEHLAVRSHIIGEDK